MSPAQIARRLDALADGLTARRLPTIVDRVESGRPGFAIPLGVAVAATLHAVSADIKARTTNSPPAVP